MQGYHAVVVKEELKNLCQTINEAQYTYIHVVAAITATYIDTRCAWSYYHVPEEWGLQ